MTPVQYVLNRQCRKLRIEYVFNRVGNTYSSASGGDVVDRQAVRLRRRMSMLASMDRGLISVPLRARGLSLGQAAIVSI